MMIMIIIIIIIIIIIYRNTSHCVIFRYFILNLTNFNEISKLSESNDIRAHNHLVRKRTLNHLVKQAK